MILEHQNTKQWCVPFKTFDMRKNSLRFAESIHTHMCMSGIRSFPLSPLEFDRAKITGKIGETWW